MSCDVSFADIGLGAIICASAKTLKTLRFRLLIRENDDPLGELCSQLEKIQNTNVIESIWVNILVFTDTVCKTGEEWGVLDDLLTRPRGWPYLKRVVVEAHLAVTGGWEDDTFDGKMQSLALSQFKKLASSETIDFIYTCKYVSGYMAL